MIYGNDWRNLLNFEVETSQGDHFLVEVVEGYQGYLVYKWNDKDLDPDMPVPKFYEFMRKGDKDHQSICGYCEGFEDAINAKDTIIYITE